MSDVLINVDELRASLDDPKLRIADTRFELSDTAKGEAAYALGHVPGAIYAHLDRDLSDHARSGLGRHPLPESATFSRWLAAVGYDAAQSWVIYDDGNGAYAARLWWMLRAIGHRGVRVLDGGYAAWMAASGPMTVDVPVVAATAVDAEIDQARSVGFDELERVRVDPSHKLVDARGAPRFRGEVEPLDPVAGHVPGAVNRPFTDNLDANGRFKSVQQLRAEWSHLLADVPPENVVHMCGSGVTACQNLLAMEQVGLHGSRLFAPSWSGWISDRSRPVVSGDA